MIRSVFFGTPRFARPSLVALLEDPAFEVLAIFTQPDRPAGRGQRSTASPIKKIAAASDIFVYQPSRLRGNREALEKLLSFEPDLLVVVAYGLILPPQFFEGARWGAVNVHASLLPQYRGAAPVIHALLNGDSETGVTIMKIDAGMDSGDLLAKQHLPIDPAVTAGDLSDQLAVLGADLLRVVVPQYVSGQLLPQPQDHSAATFAPKVKKEDGWIDWKQSSQRIHNRIRAMNPWPGAQTRLRGERVMLWRSLPSSASVSSHSPGTIVQVGDRIRVACGKREAVEILELQRPNRKRLSAGEFGRGVKLQPYEIFEPHP